MRGRESEGGRESSISCLIIFFFSRNPFLLRAQYSVYIVVGLMLGGLYWHITKDLSHGGMQNRMGSLFFLVCLLAFGSITSIDLCMLEGRERGEGEWRRELMVLYSLFRETTVFTREGEWVLPNLSLLLGQGRFRPHPHACHSPYRSRIHRLLYPLPSSLPSLSPLLSFDLTQRYDWVPT